MTLQALVLSGSIPPPDHIGIPSGVSHGLSPCCSLTTTFPLFYHSASPAFFALTEKKRTRLLDHLGQCSAGLGNWLPRRGLVESLCPTSFGRLAGREPS